MIRLRHVQNRIEQQFNIMDLIANAVDNLTKVGLSNVTPQRVQARLDSLKENWEKFSIAHEAISLAMSELNSDEQLHLKEHLYFSENFYSISIFIPFYSILMNVTCSGSSGKNECTTRL